MFSLNEVRLLGNLGANPEAAFTRNGTPVSNFSLALNESWVDDLGNKQQRVTWIDCVVFGPTAQACNENLHKGAPVLVCGRLTVDKYEDRAGVERRSVKVKADQVIFLESGNRKTSATQSGRRATETAASGSR
jgi:single-strand DNA-binding protein